MCLDMQWILLNVGTKDIVESEQTLLSSSARLLCLHKFSFLNFPRMGFTKSYAYEKAKLSFGGPCIN